MNGYNPGNPRCVEKVLHDSLTHRAPNLVRICSAIAIVYKAFQAQRLQRACRARRIVEKTAVVQDNFKVLLSFDENAFEQALSRCGYYPLLTNQSVEQLNIEEAMKAHKGQYKNEHTFRRSKGPFSIEPIYLHTPERIEAFLLLFKIALQMVVLIERTARKNINQRDYGLDGFMPNRSDVRNPKSEYMLKEFEDIVKGRIPLPDGDTYCFVSELNPLQRDILSILEVPIECYDYRAILDSS